MRRHDLITLKPDAVAQSVVCCTTDKAAHAVQQWIADGKAFVCPRQDPRSNTVQLGLAFVDHGVKHRTLVQVRRADVLRATSPHTLIDCLDLFDEKEATTLRDLAETLHAADFPLFVFGSVAWEMIAGVPYRTAASDLDLLCDVSTMQDLRFVTKALVAADRALPFRIDGELRFPADAGVNWREVVAALTHHADIDVLVKSETGVAMSTLAQLLDPAYA